MPARQDMLWPLTMAAARKRGTGRPCYMDMPRAEMPRAEIMARKKKKWRLPLGVVFTGTVGATIATMMAIAPQLTMQHSRGLFAGDMQQEFRKHGLHYVADATGTENTILRIKAPTMTRTFAEFLVRNPGKAEELTRLGFAAVLER